MQNQEYLITVLRLLREGKKVNEIAKATKRHRNTVSRYVKWLKLNVAHDLTLVTNEVLDELHTRIIFMNNRDLISFFGKLYAPTQKIETTEEIKVEEKHVSIVADYTKAVEAAVNRDIAALRARKQVDTPQTNT